MHLSEQRKKKKKKKEEKRRKKKEKRIPSSFDSRSTIFRVPMLFAPDRLRAWNSASRREHSNDNYDKHGTGMSTRNPRRKQKRKLRSYKLPMTSSTFSFGMSGGTIFLYLSLSIYLSLSLSLSLVDRVRNPDGESASHYPWPRIVFDSWSQIDLFSPPKNEQKLSTPLRTKIGSLLTEFSSFG